ncbi:MAG: hypothetical protein BHW11_02560 [Clostridium sp. CAG:62_40_43]|nr:MAG: hypothetical protein BHW11_02560 [Clostridium sp. CAG:62_40_43]
MRNRKKRIAVFLVVALFIGIACPYNQREIKEMKAVENNVSYKDGDEIQPLSVDLSGQKTVVTGGDIVIEMSEEMLNRETAKYYSSVEFTYQLKLKDEQSRVTENVSEEEWYYDYISCSIGYRETYQETTDFMADNASKNKRKQRVSLGEMNCVKWGKYLNGELNPYKFYFHISIANYYHSSRNANYYWPREVEELEITSIMFIPYENVHYGESTPSPIPSTTPVKTMPTPYPTSSSGIDKSYKTGAVRNYQVDLLRYQTSFHKNWIYFDLKDELNENWYRVENYKEVKIRYRIQYKDKEENSWGNNIMDSIKFVIQTNLEELDGYSDAVINYKGVEANKPLYQYRPCEKKELEAVMPLSFTYTTGWGQEIEHAIPIVGITIQPLTTWPEDLDSLTVTGIEFVAKEGAIYPSAPPTPSMTPTAATSTKTPQTRSTNAPSIPQKVTNLKLKAGKKKQIKISWNNQKQADGYEIYRSTKKNKGYQKIADGFKNKCNFADSKVKYAKNYYYKVRAYYLNGKNYQYGVYSDVKKLMLKRKAPAFKLKRKITTDGIHYISIRLKTCSDPYFQMWVRFGKKKYKKIPLSKHKIRKNATLNFKYTPGKGKISFRIRSYRVQNKKREYSKSKTKRI